MSLKTCCCFKCPNSLQLFYDGREGVRDDCEHNKNSEEEDQDGGHNELDVSDGNTPILLLKTLGFGIAGKTGYRGCLEAICCN